MVGLVAAICGVLILAASVVVLEMKVLDEAYGARA